MSDVKSLGYIKVQTNDVDRWRSFAFDVLGFAKGSGPDASALYLRMDERAARIVVVPGDTDEVVAVGWEVRDRPALLRVQETLQSAGVAIEPLRSNRCPRKRPTPGGSRKRSHSATRPAPRSRSSTGPSWTTAPSSHPSGPGLSPVHRDWGMWCCQQPTPTDVLGFLSRGAWRLPAPPQFGPVRIRFLGVNERHHSMAIVPSMRGGAPGLIHVMVEVDSLDAVGLALDRVNTEGFQLSSTLGRHTNDKMVSFYVRAPGGWDIEFGTDGMRVDEKYYTAEEITADSYWGHQWTGELPVAMRP
jgi:3,4-dihydroxy-9,10-secoandrosta-1,3,5(10)-triene-9,17-dione 4,5-dioxygenase